MMGKSIRASRMVALAAVVSLLWSAAPRADAAERPSAAHLLPSTTLAYLRVADAPDLVKRFQNTALGRIGNDEKVRPLLTHFYGSAAKAFATIEEEVGVPLEKLLAIPQGEIAIALVAPETGPPAVVMLMDTGNQITTAQKLLERAEAALVQQGGERLTETFEGTELVIHDMRDNQQVIHFEKDGTIVVSNNLDVIKGLLVSWEGEPEKARSKKKDDKEEEGPGSLLSNKSFGAIMRRCRGEKDERPQVTWFVDPIALVRAVSRDNFAAQAGLAVLPVLGLDGLQGAGGSLTFDAGEFDMIAHAHLLLESPRRGVLEMLAMSEGDSTPQAWVPADVSSYTNLHWDVEKTYTKLESLVDSFQEEGGFASMVKRRVSDPIGIDIERDFLAALDGRATLIQWFEPPAGLGSQATIVGLKLKDADEFAKTLDKVSEKFQDNLKKDSYSGTTYYRIAGGRQDIEEVPQDAPRTAQQRVRPCFGILGDYLILADRPAFLKKVIVTKKNPSKSLAGELDYKLIASKIRRQVGGAKPGLISFDRPEEGLRFLYDWVSAERSREQLARQAENNPFFKAVNDGLAENPLPPFGVIAKYLAPSGAMVTNDDTGFHYMAFSLRRE